MGRTGNYQDSSYQGMVVQVVVVMDYFPLLILFDHFMDSFYVSPEPNMDANSTERPQKYLD